MSNGPCHNEGIGLGWVVFVRLEKGPLKPSSSRWPTTDHNVDLQIEACSRSEAEWPDSEAPCPSL